ncbi:Poly-beta-1,6-N-acetyl-D-glucosamine synthase [compost metagenome]
MTSQRIYHTGLWELFKIGTIPGTNYIIKTKLIKELGGWDTKAITEDAAVSFEIIAKGQLIALAPQAEAYQQEPENLKVYMKQRERWGKGNLRVILDNFQHLFDSSHWRIKVLVAYYAASYFWFLLAVIILDLAFVINLGYFIVQLFAPGAVSPFQFDPEVMIYLLISGGLMYFIYVLQINLALASDFGQSTIRNFILSCVSFYTYAQLFLVLSIKAFYNMLVDKITGRQSKWYKTQRFG